jgi:hypothetical protein
MTWPLLALAAAALLALPVVSQNSSAEFTGVAFFLALYRFHARPPDRLGLVREGLVTGLLAAAVCALRQNLAVPAAVTVAVIQLRALLSERREHGPLRARRAALVRAVAVGGATLAFLSPWAVASFEAVHTPWWPLIFGNFRTPEIFVSGIPWAVRAHDASTHFFSSASFSSPILVLLLACAAAARSRGGAMGGLLLAFIANFAAMAWNDLVNYDDAFQRYQYPVYAALFFAAVCEAAGRERWPREALPVFAAAVLVVQVHATQDRFRDGFLAYAGKIADGARGQVAGADITAHRDSYLKVQRAVPAGSPIFAMVDEPYNFDFERNHIVLVDMIGIVSPGEGMPQGDPEKLATYLQDLSLRYIAYPDLDHCGPFYCRQDWVNAKNDRSLYLRVHAAKVVRMYDDLDELRRTRREIAVDDGIHVLDLATRSGP